MHWASDPWHFMGRRSVGAPPARWKRFLTRLSMFWSARRGGVQAQFPDGANQKNRHTNAIHSDADKSLQAAAGSSSTFDFDAAIENHLQWTARLRRYGHGDRQEPLDAEQVCRTDACSLGHWLERQTPVSPECAEQIAQIRQEHADFHHKAAVVVTLVQTGAPESALQSVDHGDFAHRSRRLIQSLKALRARFDACRSQPTGAKPTQ